MSFNPKSFKVLSFDVYGTLIDWETGIYSALLPLISRLATTDPNHPSSKTESQNRAFILTQYTILELEIQKENPTLAYPLVLAAIYTRLATNLHLTYTEDEPSTFGSTIGSWPAFPDTVAAMQKLSKHYKLVVLSNVDKTSFSRTLAGPLGGVKFDAIYTAEDIGSYKPDPRNFEYMLKKVGESFGAKKEEVCKVAQSLVHDHVPVKKCGMEPGVWIFRKGEESMMGGMLADLEGEVNLAAKFETLGEFAEVVEKGFEA